MRETEETISVSLDVINPLTGEMFTTDGIHSITTRNYSIRNLNFKGSIMDLFTYQSELCKSSKDIEIFRDLLFSIDKNNEFRKNITDFAESATTSRQRITKLLSDAVRIGFMKKIDRGVYIVNPFVFKAKGATNETIETIQRTWNVH